MNLISQIESLLIASGRALSLKELSKILKTDSKKIEKVLEDLENDYRNHQRGLAIVKNNYKYQLTSSADNADLVGKFLQEEVSGELTQPSLEALTIISYRQPITKEEIERIRGVNCSLILRNLLIRGLIEEKFDKQKQINYYYVSLDFVRHLGISDVSKLPDYEKLSSQESLNEILEKEKN